MKVAVQTGIRQFEVRTIPDLVAPIDGVVLRVDACGVCGSDLRRWREGLPPGVEGIVPGHEISGTVLSVGQQVTDYAPGDRLAVAPDIRCGRCWYCRHGLFNLCDNPRMLGITPGLDGGFAEQLLLTREVLERGMVHPIPAHLSSDAGALSETCASVLAAHEKVGTTLNDTVVIIGAGPIGCLHVAISQARGARAFIIERSGKRREMVERFSPDAIISAEDTDIVEEVRRLTDGRGADIAICANSDPATQEQAVRMVRKQGKVVLFGGVPKASPMTTLNSNLIHYGEIEVVGAFSYRPTAHELAIELYSRDAIPVEKLITHRFPLDQIGKAFEIAASGEGLKVIVDPRMDEVQE